MGKIAIHKYQQGSFHPRFGGKAWNYLVVSGANPLGPRGGQNGKFGSGCVVRKHFRSSPGFHSDAAHAAARAYAIQLAVEEGLELIGTYAENHASDQINKVDLISDIGDSRVRRSVNIVIRPNQARFRNELIDAYEARCCMSGESVIETLQAAHIRPHIGGATDSIINGLLLRADLHLLFDSHLIGIDSDLKIVISQRLAGTAYQVFADKQIYLPQEKFKWPNLQALDWHLGHLRR